MQTAKHAHRFKDGWQRITQLYGRNISGCWLGSFMVFAGINNLTTVGVNAFDLIFALVGAFVIGASSRPVLLWFQRQWHSEDTEPKGRW